MGRYDTSLYLKAQVDNLTGHNEELRTELKEARFEATKANVELEKFKGKVRSLFFFAFSVINLVISSMTTKLSLR